MRQLEYLAHTSVDLSAILGGRRFGPCRVRQHFCFVEIDHEMFSTVILSLPLIQERQLSDFGERMCTSTCKPLRGLILPRKKV